ncbi:PepSY domain-containing protein [Thauera sp.]|jgi:hypothetical protein|uniref:PepSY domain-containing protein n=1 Tax=Thauera sp. TaxID=1905334 RepID=UPI002A36382A|nr:PepSY domain-containing protein [Thauera sp.]MDX9886962.1 PepSY domain-containing protein [Thauera sp.]
MRATTLITTLALSAAIFGAGAVLVPAIAQQTGAVPTPAAATTQPAGLSLQEVLAKLEAAGYRNFEEAERERNKYEVKAIDPEGRRVEVDVDAMSGEILKTELKRSK